jgi:hypothetical protein
MIASVIRCGVGDRCKWTRLIDHRAIRVVCGRTAKIATGEIGADVKCVRHSSANRCARRLDGTERMSRSRNEHLVQKCGTFATSIRSIISMPWLVPYRMRATAFCVRYIQRRNLNRYCVFAVSCIEWG